MPAAIIALIGYVESIAVARKLAERGGYAVDASQELVAFGFANMVGSVTSAYPVAGGFGRSAVNAQAGARTTLASVLSVIIVMVVLGGLNTVIALLPNTVLAAVILVAVLGLIDVAEAKHLWNASRQDFFLWCAAVLLTLALGVEFGIAAAVVLRHVSCYCNSVDCVHACTVHASLYLLPAHESACQHAHVLFRPLIKIKNAQQPPCPHCLHSFRPYLSWPCCGAPPVRTTPCWASYLLKGGGRTATCLDSPKPRWRMAF